MMETTYKLEYRQAAMPTGGIPVIVAAAGSSTRMKGIHKLFAPLCGVPVLARTLMALEESPDISSIIVVAREQDVPAVQRLAEAYMIAKMTDLVSGGATRQESVAKGLARLAPDVQNVLIHDGARPLIEQAVIHRVTEALKEQPAVACGMPPVDTIKQVDDNGKVIATLDRSRLCAVQTPQGVRVAAYKHAIEQAGDVGAFTDDLSVMEAAGHTVCTVEGSRRNLKITTQEDLMLAEFFISREEEE